MKTFLHIHKLDGRHEPFNKGIKTYNNSVCLLFAKLIKKSTPFTCDKTLILEGIKIAVCKFKRKLKTKLSLLS